VKGAARGAAAEGQIIDSTLVCGTPLEISRRQRDAQFLIAGNASTERSPAHTDKEQTKDGGTGKFL